MKLSWSEQPVLGIVAAVLVLGLCLSLSVSLPPKLLEGWVGVVFTAGVPVLILQTTLGRDRMFAASAQPMRGFQGLLVFLASGLVLAAAVVASFGHGRAAPTPFVMFPLICAVPATLCQVFLLEAWPFASPKRGLLSTALQVLVTTYGVVALMDWQLFDFHFMQGTPDYAPALDPHGLFDARAIVAIAVGCAGIALALVALDGWPVTRLATRLGALSRQPGRGAANVLISIAVALALYALCVVALGVDVSAFLSRICVSFIFGIFVMLVLLQGRVYQHFAQPLRGLLLVFTGAVLAAVAYSVYRTLAVGIGGVDSAAPGGELETWISTAMLAITFPAMSVFADMFEFWPLIPRGTKPSLDN